MEGTKDFKPKPNPIEPPLISTYNVKIKSFKIKLSKLKQGM